MEATTKRLAKDELLVAMFRALLERTPGPPCFLETLGGSGFLITVPSSSHPGDHVRNIVGAHPRSPLLLGNLGEPRLPDGSPKHFTFM